MEVGDGGFRYFWNWFHVPLLWGRLDKWNSAPPCGKGDLETNPFALLRRFLEFGFCGCVCAIVVWIDRGIK